MAYSEFIDSIEQEWAPPVGALWCARQGIMDNEGLSRLLTLLKSIQVSEEDDIPKRFVSVVWLIPMFLNWQEQRLREQGVDIDPYIQMQGLLSAEVQRILGMP